MAKRKGSGKRPGQPPPAASGKSSPKDQKQASISWRWSKFDPHFPPGSQTSVGDDFDDHLLRRFQEMERLTRAELHSPVWPDYDEYDVESLPLPVKDRLTLLKIDTPRLAHIKVTGERRLWAVPPDEDNVVFLVWWDPDHKVQEWNRDSKARNTQRKRRKKK